MDINKINQEPYQLYYGINENKLYYQIVERKGIIKYNFESKNELDMTTVNSICMSIQKAAYEFFDPKHFQFDDDFVLASEFPQTMRFDGEKLTSKGIVKCISFNELRLYDFHSRIFIETFLPFEKPLQKEMKTNLEFLINDINNYRGSKWHLTGNPLVDFGGMAE